MNTTIETLPPVSLPNGQVQLMAAIGALFPSLDFSLVSPHGFLLCGHVWSEAMGEEVYVRVTANLGLLELNGNEPIRCYAELEAGGHTIELPLEGRITAAVEHVKSIYFPSVNGSIAYTAGMEAMAQENSAEFWQSRA